MKASEYGSPAECGVCGHTAGQHSHIRPNPCVASPRCRCMAFAWPLEQLKILTMSVEDLPGLDEDDAKDEDMPCPEGESTSSS